jgi:seryl-tRNA synthetase
MSRLLLEHFSAADGLATFGPAMVEVLDLIDRAALAWAADDAAMPMLFPPLMRLADLRRIDYLDNFPHLGLFVAPLRAEALADAVARAVDAGAGRLPSDRLDDCQHVLPSAACYNVYVHLRGTELDAPVHVTTRAQCFRNEGAYEDLARLRSFAMREIVHLGDRDVVTACLARSKRHVLDFAASLGLPLEVQVATDPFYESDGARATMQRLFPVKEELVYRSGAGAEVALASVNFHRNFFGERFDIRDARGEFVFTGCMGIGLERWAHALLDHHGGDLAAAADALAAHHALRPGCPPSGAGV